MRVLGSDVVQDPTKMEAHVRKQMADRLKKHHKVQSPSVSVVLRSNWLSERLNDDREAKV